MNTKNVLLGLLTGLAVGATLGILFSPEKGSKTRNKLSETGDDILEGIEDKFAELSKLFMSKYEAMAKSPALKDVKSEFNKILEDNSVSIKS